MSLEIQMTLAYETMVDQLATSDDTAYHWKFSQNSVTRSRVDIFLC